MGNAVTGIVTSWQTTVAGIVQWIAIAAPQIVLLFDAADLGTDPNWNVIVASTVVMLGLFGARDSGVTSEDAGAK